MFVPSSSHFEVKIVGNTGTDSLLKADPSSIDILQDLSIFRILFTDVCAKCISVSYRFRKCVRVFEIFDWLFWCLPRVGIGYDYPCWEQTSYLQQRFLYVTKRRKKKRGEEDEEEKKIKEEGYSIVKS